jgi:hypothetical protein
MSPAIVLMYISYVHQMTPVYTGNDTGSQDIFKPIQLFGNNQGFAITEKEFTVITHCINAYFLSINMLSIPFEEGENSNLCCIIYTFLIQIKLQLVISKAQQVKPGIWQQLINCGY